jgi:hypothetical protein
MCMAPIILGSRQRRKAKQGANQKVGQADERYAVRSRHNALICVGPTHWFAVYRLLL